VRATTQRGDADRPPDDRERVLAGAPAARRLYREVAADPAAARCVDIVGPGGSGKTVLLNALAELYSHVGVEVLRGSGELPAELPQNPEASTDAAILIDDGHRLDDAQLGHLRAVAAGGKVQLVVSHRPSPRSSAMSALGALLGAKRSPLVLGPLDRAGVAARAALLLGTRPAPDLVDLVVEQTRGQPSMVDRLISGLHAAGRIEPAEGRPGEAAASRLAAAAGTIEPPASVLEHLRYELDALPDGVRELLLGLAAGAPLDPAVLGPTLEIEPASVGELAEAAGAAGLLDAGGELIPLVRQAVLRQTPPVRRLEVQQRLAQVQLDRGASVLAAASGLIGTGASGPQAAAAFEAAGDEALQGGLQIAGELYTAAVQAGAEPAPLAARRAQAAASVADLDTALALADQALALTTSDADRARAVAVAAVVLAQRGMLARSAELYRWLGSIAPGQSDVEAAVPALIGIGELAAARKLLEPAPAGAGSGPPRLLAGAEMLMAQGMYATVTGSPAAALSQLTRAAALLEPSGSTSLLPDTPAALAALVALHCGELDVAQSVLERAVAGQLGGRAAAARHRLLQAWIAMQRGATGQARALLAEVAPSGGNRLEPRDELVAAALEVALARRSSDLPALMAAWARAREAIVRHPVDLYVLQPLGELLVGAARLREQSWVQPHLEEAQALLAKLGDPPLWAVPLHWSGMQAAIAGEQHAAAEHHAAALEKAATGSRYAAAMATAAKLWLRILAGTIDAAAVEAGARGLHAVGLTWEGGRLAGQAAIRTTERKDMTALLSCARSLQVGVTVAVPHQGTAKDPATSASATASTAPEAEATDNRLSDREREVAELVLSGLTYKQIGEQLFISAKTVEHHMARIRQRLGSGSRGELFAHLRALVGPSDT